MTTTPSNTISPNTEAQEKTSNAIEDSASKDTSTEQNHSVELDAVTGYTGTVAKYDTEEYEYEEGTGLAAFGKKEDSHNTAELLSEETDAQEESPSDESNFEPSTPSDDETSQASLSEDVLSTNAASEESGNGENATESMAEPTTPSVPSIATETSPPQQNKPKFTMPAQAEPEEEPMTLLQHLGELRVRLVRCFIAIGLGFVVCYSFAERIFNELMVPLVSAMPADSKLIFTALPEAFFVYMQVALVAAAFLVSPYIFYQIWAFISPGLYEEEKKSAIPIAFFSAAFFIGGAAFCYFQVFPYAFQFFMGFATDLILPMPSLSEYLGFALKMLIAFGLIFEMPLFSFFLSRVGIVNAPMMRKARKYAILCMFIVAAILTPPDIFSQTLMAGPMILLYEVSILIAAAVGKKKEEKEDEEKSSENERPLQGD